jgi:hypothetical protein
MALMFYQRWNANRNYNRHCWNGNSAEWSYQGSEVHKQELLERNNTQLYSVYFITDMEYKTFRYLYAVWF